MASCLISTKQIYEMSYRVKPQNCTFQKYSIPVHLSIPLLEPYDMYAIKLVLLDAQLCTTYIHTHIMA